LSDEDDPTVSSILKALKKLEGESTTEAVADPWPRTPGTRRTFPSPLRPARPYKWVAALFLIAGVLTVVGWFAAGRSPDSDPVASPRGSAPDGSTEGSTSNAKTVVQKPKSDPSTRSRGIPLAALPSSRPPSAIQPDAQRVPEETADPQRLPDVEVSAEAGLLPPLPLDNIGVTVEPAPHPVAEATDIPEWTDGRLSLQAIAWARLPGKRMAVINDRIVREGGNVEGVAVIRIDRDAIIIGEGEQTWRLVFKLQ